MARIHFLQHPPESGDEVAPVPDTRAPAATSAAAPVIVRASRIHPLTAAAAVSVITVSMVGVGIMTGVLPDLRAPRASQLPAPVAPAIALPAVTRAAPATAIAAPATAIASPATTLPKVAAAVAPVHGQTSVSAAPVAPADALAPGETLVAPDALTTTAQAQGTRVAVPGAAPARPAQVAVLVPTVARRPRESLPLRSGVAGTSASGRSTFSGGLGHGTDRSGSGVDAGPGLDINDRVRDAGRTGLRERLPTEKHFTAMPAPAPRITPVLRAPLPLDPTPSADPVARSIVPSYPPVTGPVPAASVGSSYQASRYAGNGYQGTPYQGRTSQDTESQAGSGARIGGALGSTIGNGIDRTLSVIAGVLGAHRAPAAPVQDFPLDQSRYQTRDPQRDQPYANGAYER
jgi:hypothetical protein